jgi:exonuclease SbcC
MAIKRILIENFQSHAHTEIEIPSPGVTALVGESDQGKSAVVRALRWLFLNEPRGTGFVRAGERMCRVRVEYTDGTTLERVRSGDDNTYILNGRIFRGFGIDPPLEVQEFTGIRKIDLGESIVPNIAGQLEPPFIIGLPGTARANFIGAVSRASIFDTALKKTLTDNHRAKQEAQRLNEEIASLEEEIASFSNLPFLERVVEDAISLISETEQLVKKKERLQELAVERDRWKTEIERCLQIFVATANTKEAEEMYEQIEELKAKLTLLETLQQHQNEVLREHETSIKVITATEATQESAFVATEVEALLQSLKNLQKLSAEQKTLKKEIALATTIAKATNTAPKAEEILVELATNAANILSKLKPLLQEAVVVKKEIQRFSEQIELSQQAFMQTVEEFKETLKDLRRCPVCYSEIGEEVIKNVITNLIQ